MTFLEILICAVLVSIAGFMSAAEISLFSLSRFQLRSLKERFRGAHRKIKRMLGDPGGLLITVLMVNEVMNIALSTVIAEAVSRSWEHGWPRVHAFHLRWFPEVPAWAFQTLLGIVLTAPVVLFFCEMTPKVLAARANELVAPISAGPLSWVYGALKPVRVALTRFLAVVSRLAGGPGPGAAHGGDARAILKEDEFLLMVEEANREGSVDPSELGLIRRVFDLDETPVSEVYTPIIHVHTLSVNTTVKGAIAAMRAGQRYSRIPVTAGPTKKQVVGVLYTKDLLLSKLEPEASAYATVSTLMRKPFVVSPSARLTVLFRKFKQHKTHMAIVESAPGEAVGIVTMADVLGALFEDLLEADEDDESTAPGGAR